MKNQNRQQHLTPIQFQLELRVFLRRRAFEAIPRQKQKTLQSLLLLVALDALQTTEPWLRQQLYFHPIKRHWRVPFPSSQKSWFGNSIMLLNGLEQSQLGKAYKPCTILDFLKYFVESPQEGWKGSSPFQYKI